mmetsp:Transcript_1512/g.5348  ORF Transcript_1512/g.5348 Transcript_1512/m.5348 type:complete len:245 (+) Transcript_1512:1274-2008(+)
MVGGGCSPDEHLQACPPLCSGLPQPLELRCTGTAALRLRERREVASERLGEREVVEEYLSVSRLLLQVSCVEGLQVGHREREACGRRVFVAGQLQPAHKHGRGLEGHWAEGGGDLAHVQLQRRGELLVPGLEAEEEAGGEVARSLCSVVAARGDTAAAAAGARRLWRREGLLRIDERAETAEDSLRIVGHNALQQRAKDGTLRSVAALEHFSDEGNPQPDREGVCATLEGGRKVALFVVEEEQP